MLTELNPLVKPLVSVHSANFSFLVLDAQSSGSPSRVVPAFSGIKGDYYLAAERMYRWVALLRDLLHSQFLKVVQKIFVPGCVLTVAVLPSLSFPDRERSHPLPV